MKIENRRQKEVIMLKYLSLSNKKELTWVEVCGTFKKTNCLTTNLYTMNVDVEIYMNNIIKFFRENPTDLLNLVPKDKEEFFYIKIKEVAIENYKKGEDVSLTQSQLIDVCSEINQPDKQVVEEISKNFIQKTKFGYLFLN